MTRAFVLFGLLVAAGATGLVARQEPRFRGGANMVSVYATVVESGGRLVTDLRESDFEVYDNGVRQDITVFASDLQPITIVVMLDRSGSMKPHFERVRDAAEAFVAELLPDDRARIGSFSDRIELDPETFTSDRDALVRILHEDLQPPGTTPLWNATAAAMNALAREQGRRVILVFTDGKDTPGIGGNATFEEIQRRSQVEEIMVYAIGFSEVCEPDRDGRPPRPPIGGGVLYQRIPGIPGGGPPIPGGGPRRPGVPVPRFPPPGPTMPGLPPRVPSPPEPRARVFTDHACADAEPDPDLPALAAVGGGGYFELDSTDDLRSTFARVADELHHQYLLAFSAGKLDRRIHRLDVRVRQPQLTVRARKTYLAD
jgi:VWFA-related protein